jgi:hypothetical protein
VRAEDESRCAAIAQCWLTVNEQSQGLLWAFEGINCWVDLVIPPLITIEFLYTCIWIDGEQEGHPSEVRLT